jgi:membrane protein implicated in regulation of membrane protease activity
MWLASEISCCTAKKMKGGLQMPQMMPYVWVAVFIAAIVIESQTMGIVAIWFMPGALIAMILAMLNVPVWIQALVFILLSVLLLIFGRRVFKSLFPKTKYTPTNVDALIGREAVITEEVNNLQGVGAAKLNGQIWSARAKNEKETLLPGDVVIVCEIRGVKLICSKKQESV